MQRFHGEGFRLCAAGRGPIRELHLTLHPRPGESLTQLWRRLNHIMQEHDARIVRQEVFGPVANAAEGRETLARELGAIAWPITWTEGRSCSGDALAGTHVLAVAGTVPEPLRSGAEVVGASFSDGDARHCLLGGIAPSTLATPQRQAEEVFAGLLQALGQAGLRFANVARTWFFLDDILGWYGGFNQVRTGFFHTHHVFDGIIPASTGIGTRNPGGVAAVAGAWAVEPFNASARVTEVFSPKQCPATRYGSSFSRAVEIDSGGLRRVLVSGTASIEPGGRSVCGGDPEAQIDLTMEVVRAILVSRGLDLPDATRATAYFRRAGDASLFGAWCARRGLADWPLIATEAVVCRDELLFEVEVDAIGLLPAANGQVS